MEFNLEDFKIWYGIDFKQNIVEDLYSKFGVDKNIIDVIGYVLVFYFNDE